MNEFAAKKLGEILAFNKVGLETIEKGRNALASALGEAPLADMEEKFRLHGDGILKIAADAGVQEIVLAKAEKTKEKLGKMRDLYIGEEWDNTTELFEWSGFFEGAAIVHWAVIRGVAEGLNNETLLTFAHEGINWHYELLELAEGELSERGEDKTTAS